MNTIYKSLDFLHYSSYRVGNWRIGDNESVWCDKSGEWKIVKPGKDKDGYHRLSIDGICRYIHHLVLHAFHYPRPEGMESRHYPDRNVNNNRADNLLWGTHKQNMKDAVEMGVFKRRIPKLKKVKSPRLCKHLGCSNPITKRRKWYCPLHKERPKAIRSKKIKTCKHPHCDKDPGWYQQYCSKHKTYKISQIT